MADEPTTTTTAPGSTVTLQSYNITPDEPATGTAEQPDDLGEAGKKAIAAERAAKKAAEKQLNELQKRLAEFEDRDKTEAQKLAERAAAAELERDALMLTAMRQRVALAKGHGARWRSTATRSCSPSRTSSESADVCRRGPLPLRRHRGDLRRYHPERVLRVPQP